MLKAACLALNVSLIATQAFSDIEFVPRNHGDHFVFVPAHGPREILVIAHGTRPERLTAKQTALNYLERWTNFAEAENLLIIAPVFDDRRFGNKRGGYGGYRGLFGKYVGADQFVIDLVEEYAQLLNDRDDGFLLYGHSAGGQFAIRFAVQHPEQVSQVIVTAPGRYSYPTKGAKWPYGAGDFQREIVWEDGTRQKVRRSGELRKYANAAGKIVVLVGTKDTDPQPERPAHTGRNRVELALSWTEAMNRNAARFEQTEPVGISVISGLGHNPWPLIAHAQTKLRGVLAEKYAVGSEN